MKEEILVEPVLVGREGELEKLQNYLYSTTTGKGLTVFVSGEAGSGKTRLINEFLSSIKANEVHILRSWCLSNIAAPYFPFMEAFNAYFSKTPSEEKPDIKAWLAGPKQARKSEKLQNLTPQGWQDPTFAAVTEALSSSSAKKIVILFIEDMHWADSASLSLLHYIPRTMSPKKILVLVTFRSEELTADAEGPPHPLEEELRLMKLEDIFCKSDLPFHGKNRMRVHGAPGAG